MHQAHDSGHRHVPRQAERIACGVACNSSITDHDLWRARKFVKNELYRIERLGIPVSIRLLYTDRIIESAQRLRSLSGAEFV